MLIVSCKLNSHEENDDQEIDRRNMVLRQDAVSLLPGYNVEDVTSFCILFQSPVKQLPIINSIPVHAAIPFTEAVQVA